MLLRYGGKAGKMGRIKQQEELEAAKAWAKLGLTQDQPAAGEAVFICMHVKGRVWCQSNRWQARHCPEETAAIGSSVGT